MFDIGHIKLHRSILSWEWYQDTNTTRLFIHLLLTANYEDVKWRGIVIKRGQRICSRAMLAEETNLTEQNIRTALNRLVSTNEITKQSTPKGTVITLNNYDKYQAATSQTTKAKQQPTTNQQTNQQSTNRSTSKVTKQKKLGDAEIAAKKCEKQNIATNRTASAQSENQPADQPLYKKYKNQEYLYKYKLSSTNDCANDFEQPIYDIIAYLNEKAGKAYKPTSKHTQRHINARLKEGFAVQDFKKVIDDRCRAWNKAPAQGKADMRLYLRPETLFGTKFEGYLNCASGAAPDKDPETGIRFVN